MIAVDIAGRLHVCRGSGCYSTTARITYDAEYHQAACDHESSIKYEQITFRHTRVPRIGPRRIPTRKAKQYSAHDEEALQISIFTEERAASAAAIR